MRKPINNPLIPEPLIQQGNGCTIPVKIHPIRSEKNLGANSRDCAFAEISTALEVDVNV